MTIQQSGCRGAHVQFCFAKLQGASVSTVASEKVPTLMQDGAILSKQTDLGQSSKVSPLTYLSYFDHEPGWPASNMAG